MSSRKKTDYRALQARRDMALEPKPLDPPRPRLDPAQVQAAIAAGKLTRLPPKPPRRINATR